LARVLNSDSAALSMNLPVRCTSGNPTTVTDNVARRSFPHNILDLARRCHINGIMSQATTSNTASLSLNSSRLSRRAQVTRPGDGTSRHDLGRLV